MKQVLALIFLMVLGTAVHAEPAERLDAPQFNLASIADDRVLRGGLSETALDLTGDLLADYRGKDTRSAQDADQVRGYVHYSAKQVPLLIDN